MTKRDTAQLRHRHALVATLGGLSMFGPLATDMYLPGLPRLTHSLHASASATQLTLTFSLLGLGFGQILLGALSDARGRRPIVLAGLVSFIVTSLLCAISPSIWVLIVVRLLQGFAGAAGIAIGRAVVRDMYVGTDAARIFAVVLAINGVSPIVAPLAGAAILTVGTWRTVFVALALIGVVLLVMTLAFVPESLAVRDRHSGDVRDMAHTYRRLLADRRFMAPASAYALSFCALFSYISGASYVLENVYHLSPQLFSVVFACNSAGIVAFTLISGRLVSRFDLVRLLLTGLGVSLAGTLMVLVVCVMHTPVMPLILGLFVVAASQGLVMPNAISRAMNARPEAYGSASGLIGLGQFGMGALVAPLVGLSGTHDGTPMGVVMLASAAGALTVLLWLSGGWRAMLASA
ncbi:MAG: multidrug effflux MFS transporter [Solirubrobacteraceae bacterium]